MADNRTSELDGLLDSGRLRHAARGCKSEADLARRLGITPVAYKSRKLRWSRRHGKAFPTLEALQRDDEPTNPQAKRWAHLEAFDREEAGPDPAGGGAAAEAAATGESPLVPVSPLPPGHYVKGVSSLVAPDGTLIQQWVKTAVEQQQQQEAIFDAIRHLADEWPERIPIAPPDHADEDLLCIYLLGDPHFGMYAWAAESGDDYNLELAEQYHVAAMRALVEASPPAKHSLIISLGDLSHADNSTNRTPTSGHTLDVDTRRPKVQRSICRSIRSLVDLSLAKHEQSSVWLVPGNHDADTTTMLQLGLAMYYENNERVTIEESPAIAFYRRHGENLIGATHTHTMKDRASLGEMMATHRKEDWGQTSYRYYYCGHVHHDSVIETRSGVLVETLRTLAAKDKWAADNFYNAGRDMKCDVLHRTDGRIIRNTIGIRQIKRRLGLPEAA